MRWLRFASFLCYFSVNVKFLDEKSLALHRRPSESLCMTSIEYTLALLNMHV